MTFNRRALLAGGITLPLAAQGLAATAHGQAAVTSPEKVVPLWPGHAPGGEGVTVTETFTDNREKPDQINRSISGVRVPDLRIRYPQTPNGAAVLILPGGGFRTLAYDKEGQEIAVWLLELGFVTGVLKYRLPADGWKAGIDVAIQDGQRAMRLLRHEVENGQVGVMGFSAGGYLGAALATRFTESLDGNIDSISALNARPDFVALIYPAFGAPTGGLPPLDRKVTTETSPAFIVHAFDDPKAPVAGSLGATMKLMSLKVPVELHTYERGGHGFALRRPPSETWPNLFDAWSRARLAIR